VAQLHREVGEAPSLEVSQVERGHLGMWPVGIMGWDGMGLDVGIVEVFSNLSGSMIQWLSLGWEETHSGSLHESDAS